MMSAGTHSPLSQTPLAPRALPTSDQQIRKLQTQGNGSQLFILQRRFRVTFGSTLPADPAYSSRKRGPRCAQARIVVDRPHRDSQQPTAQRPPPRPRHWPDRRTVPRPRLAGTAGAVSLSPDHSSSDGSHAYCGQP